MDRNRLYLLGAAALGAIALVVVVIFVAGGNGSSATTTSADTTSTSTAPPTASIAGIPQHGDTLGRATAPVTITVFEDPQCPYCRDWNVGTLPTVVTDYVRTGRVKLVYRGINIIGPNSDNGLRAIYAAGQQNRLWQMVDALYARQGSENSGWITDSLLRAAAKEAGANGDAILSVSPSALVTSMLKNAEAEAKADAIAGTPTFVVQRAPALPKQLQLSGLDPASFEAALAAVLQ